MLARFGGGQNIELVQSDDAVNRLAARDVRDRPDIIFRRGVAFDGLDFIDRCPSPRIIEQILARHERYVPARVLTFFQKFVPFVFAGDANDMILDINLDSRFKIQDLRFILNFES